MVTVHWRGGMAFEAVPPSGSQFTMDAVPEFGGKGLGPTPVETLIGALAACSAMDVVGILAKQRQQVSEYRVEVEWTRGPEGQFPRPVTSVVVRHILDGKDLDPGAVAKAVELSDTKYCSVIATLRINVPVTSEYRLAGSESLADDPR